MITVEADSIHDSQAPAALLAVLRRRWRQFAIPCALLSIATVALAFLWPPLYRAAATILIEQQEIPTDLIPTTVTSYADQRLHVIAQRVMTSANLLGMIRKFDLYPDDGDEPPEVLVDEMNGDIAMNVVSADVVDPRNGRPTQATIAFTVSYEHESPELAYRVASELTSLYLNENLKSRNQTVEDTTQFLSQEAARLGREVMDLEQRLAAFKEDNIGSLPELTDLNMRFLDRIEHDRAQVDEQIRAADQRRIYLQSMLQGLAQNAPLPSAQQVLSPAERAQVLEATLVSLMAIYGSEHPDVQRVQRELAGLKNQTGGSLPSAQLGGELAAREADLAAARQQYGPDHPDVQRLERVVAELQAAAAATATEVPADVGASATAAGAATPAAADFAAPATLQLPRTDPSYVQLYGQLQATLAESAALASKRKEIDAQYADMQKRLETTPKIESDYRGLMREYDAASARYQDIKSKLAEAQLAESLEAGRKGERFTVIEPATRPEEPVEPNRWAILFMGLLIAIATGLGWVAAAEALDGSVRGFARATTLVGQAPLAVIPVITTAAEAAGRSLRRRLLAGGATAALAVGAVLVHLLVLPLGTIWLLALKRFGL